jgi:hypothetical protein
MNEPQRVAFNRMVQFIESGELTHSFNELVTHM